MMLLLVLYFHICTIKFYLFGLKYFFFFSQLVRDQLADINSTNSYIPLIPKQERPDSRSDRFPIQEEQNLGPIPARDPRQGRYVVPPPEEVEDRIPSPECEFEEEERIKQERLDDDPNWAQNYLNQPDNIATEDSAVEEQVPDQEVPVNQETENPVGEPVQESLYNLAIVKEEPKDSDDDETPGDDHIDQPVATAVPVKQEPDDGDKDETQAENIDDGNETDDSDDTLPLQLPSPRAPPSPEPDVGMVGEQKDEDMETEGITDQKSPTGPDDNEESEAESDETEELNRDEESQSPTVATGGFSSARDLDEINEEIMANHQASDLNESMSNNLNTQGYSRTSSGEESNDEDNSYQARFSQDLLNIGDVDAVISYADSPMPCYNEDDEDIGTQKRPCPSPQSDVPPKKSRFKADIYVKATASSESVAETSAASTEQPVTVPATRTEPQPTRPKVNHFFFFLILLITKVNIFLFIG